MKDTYKLIKKYPGLPNDWEEGMILGRGDETDWQASHSPCDGKYSNHYIVQSHVESSPEYFKPHIFTTEDGVDIYDGDDFYWCRTYEESDMLTDPLGSIGLYTGSVEGRSKSILYKWFSSRIAAQQWLDTTETKFEVGEWLYKKYFDSEVLFRFERVEKHVYYTNEYYHLVGISDGISKVYSGPTELPITDELNVTKATTEQIESILNKVAKFKGFCKGVKYKNATDADHIVVCPTDVFVYNKFLNYEGIYAKSNASNSKPAGWIYCNGKWAEIISTSKEVNEVNNNDDSTIPKYVKLTHNIGTRSIGQADTNAFDKNKGRVYDTSIPFPHSFGLVDEGDDWSSAWKTYYFNFTSATKEEYDKQQAVKELMVTIDGDIMDVSFNGNVVTVKYK